MAVEAAQEVFDGVMLGDGGLEPMNKSAYFLIDLSGTDHIDWLKVIKDALVSLSVPISPMFPRLNKGVSHGKVYYGCLLSSKSCAYLTEQYNRWYLNNVKVVPECIKLTPVVIAHWFMGDGSSVLHQYKDHPGHKYVEAKFATHDYTRREVEFLRGLLEQFGIENPKVYTDRGYYFISVCNEAGSVALMNIIEPLITPSYKYRVKYPTHVYKRRGNAGLFDRLRLKIGRR